MSQTFQLIGQNWGAERGAKTIGCYQIYGGISDSNKKAIQWIAFLLPKKRAV